MPNAVHLYKIQEDENNRAIYVGFSKNSSVQMFESLKDEIKQRFIAVTVGGEDSSISAAEYILAPK